MKSFVWLDDKSKQLNWLNRNYFFVTTVFIVLLNIIVFAVHGNDYANFSVPTQYGNFSVANLFQALINAYNHTNWQHCLLNMLCFFFAGLYLERKNGSLKFLLFMVVMSLFTAFASCTNAVSIWWHGFSGVNYGLYGYIIVEFIFTLLQKDKRYLFNIIAGILILALIYFAMCFNGGTSKVSFAWYAYDLLHNIWHATGFVVGLVFGIYEQVCSLVSKFKQKSGS